MGLIQHAHNTALSTIAPPTNEWESRKVKPSANTMATTHFRGRWEPAKGLGPVPKPSAIRFRSPHESAMECHPFCLQYGQSHPQLPHAQGREQPPGETTKTLNKYRAEAANKYLAALKRLVAARDGSAFVRAPIIPSDVMRQLPINRKLKLHPKWDGGTAHLFYGIGCLSAGRS